MLTPLQTSGSCGGGAGYQVYEFTAPAAADYIFNVQGRGINALRNGTVHIRKQCGSESTETDCFESDNAGQIRNVVSLDADEKIFVFVDNRQALLIGAQADFTSVLSLIFLRPSMRWMGGLTRIMAPHPSTSLGQGKDCELPRFDSNT